jgi:catechol 2,3-dioxygenase-like lactoylglutathione lyase family enzyme
LTRDPPRVTGVLETALYVHDVARSRAFYTRLFGFPVLTEDDRLCALDVAGRAVLLLFRKRGTTETIQIPGGAIPPHDGDGNLHCAFAIPAGDLEAWAEASDRWDRDREPGGLAARRHQPLLPRPGRPSGGGRDTRGVGDVLSLVGIAVMRPLEFAI